MMLHAMDSMFLFSVNTDFTAISVCLFVSSFLIICSKIKQVSGLFQ